MRTYLPTFDRHRHLSHLVSHLFFYLLVDRLLVAYNMSFGGQDVDVSKLTPAQQEIGARLVLAQDRLSSLAPFLFR